MKLQHRFLDEPFGTDVEVNCDHAVEVMGIISDFGRFGCGKISNEMGPVVTDSLIANIYDQTQR